MNVASPHWGSFQSPARHPLSTTLSGAFQVPRDFPPSLLTLIEQLERRSSKR
jgi:hypothetical protein